MSQFSIPKFVSFSLTYSVHYQLGIPFPLRKLLVSCPQARPSPQLLAILLPHLSYLPRSKLCGATRESATVAATRSVSCYELRPADGLNTRRGRALWEAEKGPIIRMVCADIRVCSVQQSVYIAGKLLALHSQVDSSDHEAVW